MVNSQLELHRSTAAIAAPQPRAASLLVWAPAAMLWPSEVARVNRAKLALLGVMVTTFFLFATKIWFVGGAGQFLDYAGAIVHGTTLPPLVAQRDAGYPLLLVLGGYPWLHSFIPVLLIQALFAVLLPITVYEGLRRLAPATAYYVGLASIASFSPLYFMKMIHHDQLYIFLAQLMSCALLVFVQTKQMRYLYFFTAAAICASLARPAGNAVFPLFIVVAYVAVRGRFVHYVTCVTIFAASVAGYAWHRQVIFDLQHAAETPSYFGQQAFYNPYLNTFDYGIRLSPEVGPNFARAVEELRKRLQPDPQHSELIHSVYANTQYKIEFARANFDPLSADQLIDRVLTAPNWEYYTLLSLANDDRVLLAAAWEIARAYPGLIVRYSVRNLLHFIFEPGYKHSRFNFNPFLAEGLVFYPSAPPTDQNVRRFPPQAARELSFDPASREPSAVAAVFAVMQAAWLKSYRLTVTLTGVLMCIAWLTAVIAIGNAALLRLKPASADKSRRAAAETFSAALIASILIASLVFSYSAAVTAVFAEPDFRYRQISDLQAISIAGLGLIALQFWLGAAVSNRNAVHVGARWDRAVHWLHVHDPWQRLTATALRIVVIAVVFGGFAWWALFMVAHTRP
jgi:hypothetical protein